MYLLRAAMIPTPSKMLVKCSNEWRFVHFILCGMQQLVYVEKGLMKVSSVNFPDYHSLVQSYKGAALVTF